MPSPAAGGDGLRGWVPGRWLYLEDMGPFEWGTSSLLLMLSLPLEGRVSGVQLASLLSRSWSSCFYSDLP